LLDLVLGAGALLMWRVACETLATIFRTAERIRELTDRSG